MRPNVRAAAVAGMFYPEDPAVLRKMVDGFFDQIRSCAPEHPPKALIVPHAGYMYSGVVAAAAYALLKPEAIKRVVMVGPSHRLFFRGLAAPESLTWETPLGRVQLDPDFIAGVSRFSSVLISDKPHQSEHCLEVQLPFLQRKLNSFSLAPFIAGDARPEDVATVLDALWGGPETLIVISSDLSHYETYDHAVRKDSATAAAILDLQVSGLDSDCACGLLPIAGLIHLARKKGMRVEQVDLRNSGDTAGSRNQVVGYGAFAFYE